ncbi:ABC transporter substrate-binding protein [Halalkalibacter urbisdiaboli]|uniref:ABC transporter substrate-binding protein n=1 Tax=Halalkalibacter urbisdiaboli TaxID=1960589 RepID=UPI000B4502E6|nr:extracellular solute-binding protein [Halalkalibacter urbisdiaboli]
MKKQWTKKFFVIMVSILLLAVVGCSNSNEPTNNTNDIGNNEEKASSDNDKKEQVKLVVWLWPGMGIEDQIKQYADENGIEVDIQLAEFADVHSNLTTALAAGSGAPDISAVEVKGINKMSANPEHFYNLLDLGADEIEGDYLDWKWQQAMALDGTLLGIPTDIGPQTMSYRLDVFEKAGLPTDREEVAKLVQTWDDWIELGEQIKEKTGAAMIDSAQGLYSVIEGQGENKYYDEQGNVVIEENPQIEKAYSITMEAIEKGLTSGFEQWSTEWGAGMTNGDFATVLTPAWMTGFMKENAPDAAGLWDMAPLPEGSGNWGGSFLTIPKQSEHPEEAYALIKWLLSPEQQLVTFQNNGNFPSTPSIYESEDLQNFTSEYYSGAPLGQLFGEAAKEVKLVHEGPASIQIEEAILDAVKRVEDGQATPDDSWQQAMKQLERQLRR